MARSPLQGRMAPPSAAGAAALVRGLSVKGGGALAGYLTRDPQYTFRSQVSPKDLTISRSGAAGAYLTGGVRTLGVRAGGGLAGYLASGERASAGMTVQRGGGLEAFLFPKGVPLSPGEARARYGPYNPNQPRVPKGVPEGGEWLPYGTAQRIFRGFRRGLREGWDEESSRQYVANSLVNLFTLIPRALALQIGTELVTAFRDEVLKAGGPRPTALQVRARRMRFRRLATGPDDLGFAVQGPSARRIG